VAVNYGHRLEFGALLTGSCADPLKPGAHAELSEAQGMNE
jgi:hypothetical protein